MQPSAADLDAARALGRKAGAIQHEQGASCPYGHRPIDLRVAWFDGFGEGRAMLEKKRKDGEPAVGVPVDP